MFVYRCTVSLMDEIGLIIKGKKNEQGWNISHKLFFPEGGVFIYCLDILIVRYVHM